MRGKKLSIGLKAALAIFAINLLMANARAATTKILHAFGTNEGNDAEGVVRDAAGNLYGTQHGASGCGTLYELTPTTGGEWEENLLYVFADGGDCYPNQNLLLDSAGNIYGTTNASPDDSTGGVYELSPTASGAWQFTVVYNLSQGQGLYADAGLIRDAAGNLYSTASAGGASNAGSVYELSPVAGGGWTETTLFSFDGGDGSSPLSGGVFDAAGNIYGTNWAGGAYTGGNAWRLTPHADGTWTETVLHNFTGDDGYLPQVRNGLVFDSAGNLYGTAEYGGRYGHGVVFELSPTVSGSWTEKVLLNFNGTNGGGPWWGLVFDTFGNLYGESAGGGANGDGVVFELSPGADGSWTNLVLHSFTGGGDGSNPNGGLIIDSEGNLYGTTTSGGTYGNGTVFEITP